MSEPALDPASRQRCKLCGGSFTVREIIDAIASFWPEIDVVISESPCCHRQEELRVEDGLVWRGYVYAAGSPHFCGMEQYAIPTLKVMRKDSVLSFEMDGATRTIQRLLPGGAP